MDETLLWIDLDAISIGSDVFKCRVCAATKGQSGTGGFPCFAFWSVQPKPHKLGSRLHFKALICGYLP